jgi:hypothetical protein
MPDHLEAPKMGLQPDGTYNLWVLHTDRYTAFYGGTVVQIELPWDALTPFQVEMAVRIAKGVLTGPALEARLHVERRNSYERTVLDVSYPTTEAN